MIAFNEIAMPLTSLAKKINAATNSAETSAKSAMIYALEAGTLLTEAKSFVQHGEWETWLIENCDVAPRTARAYMRLANTIPLLEEDNRQRVADLPVREAIKAIATNPVQPAHYPSLRVPTKDDADRTATAFRKSSVALRDAAKKIELIRSLNSAQVTVLRKKLTDALAALDAVAGTEVTL